jgi:hypothetical protein
LRQPSKRSPRRVATSAALVVAAALAVAAPVGVLAATGGTPPAHRLVAASVAAGDAASFLRDVAGSLRTADSAAARRRAVDGLDAARPSLVAPDGRKVLLDAASADEQQIRSGSEKAGRAAASRLAARLGALATELRTAAEPPHPDAARLRSILAQPDFRGADPVSQTFGRFVDAVQRWLRENLGFGFGGGAGPARVPPVIFFGVAAAALLGALAMAARAASRRRRGRMTGEIAAAAASPQPDATPEMLEQQALGLAGSGQLLQAVRVLFSGVPAMLVSLGVLKTRRNFTNGELIGESRSVRPDLTGGLAEMVGVFEVAFYGGRPMTPPDWERFHRGWRTLVEAGAGEPR